MNRMQHFAEASDDDLLRHTMAGDEDAFTALYRRHQGNVYRFALHMSGSTDIAEEVTQEVFMFLIRGAKQYDPERGSLSGFLYGVARNHVLRRLHRDRVFSDLPEESPAADEDTFGGIVRNRRIHCLRKALLALPEHYREVLVLCELEELDYSRAAEVLGCPIGTIRSRLSRARTMLAGRLRANERCPA
jgi:RNA polymerase sigma-70 factor (ECF subfamily)